MQESHGFHSVFIYWLLPATLSVDSFTVERATDVNHKAVGKEREEKEREETAGRVDEGGILSVFTIIQVEHLIIIDWKTKEIGGVMEAPWLILFKRPGRRQWRRRRRISSKRRRRRRMSQPAAAAAAAATVSSLLATAAVERSKGKRRQLLLAQYGKRIGGVQEVIGLTPLLSPTHP